MSSTGDIAAIHVALVRVVSEWSESELQRQVADAVDVALDPTAIRALYLLGMNEGALGFGELAEHAAMSRPTTSKLVSRMAAQGVVDPVRSGRTVQVQLTDAGTQAYTRLVSAGHRMVDDALHGWAPEEIAQFRRQLTRFVFALSGTAPAPPTQEESP
ncbi:MarR family winged helix-turn-helix transcriptional regulator [Microbacterium sp. MYb66]|uniref:MarR family winged helix-turn-helix transcriptional regulator n=1 Tax=Microbacterium sp. MYb66 TaxID=1848692 RepID=UPI000CFF6B65|nr:MarR family transcriptional regulator [Microbacterium sp. MYb66]PRA81236.1 MarR family transcriptional regulator [Microbacterium sp. MYb66]